jgi:hypothetical protein
MRVIALVILLALVTGCHRSGTWRDSAKNWERAFGEKQPANVVVLHSEYWRSPHIFREEGYFFEVGADEGFRKQMLARKDARQVFPRTETEKEEVLRFFGRKPDWFIPQPLERYEVWEFGPADLFNNLRLFIDKRTGILFFSDYAT